MKNKYAIEVKNIRKSFKIYFDKSNSLKERALFWKRNRFEIREVIKDISFKVKKGEAIGLVGHNGCGKSTTLKLLSKIMYPDSGSIVINGRVSSLIELGAGFHPDMSGRENIYINASIFGLTKKEIDERINDIIAFSELEEFIDNPVRTYSSGMYTRLAFSVAINVDADILLIDEILAVGDVKFQAKCFDRLRQIKSEGTTIVIVSHSLGQIEEICERSIWIDNGLIREEGVPREVHMKYLEYMQNYSMSPISVNFDPESVKRAEQDKQIVINNYKLLDKDGNESSNFKTGDSADLVFDYEVLDKKTHEASFEIAVIRNDNLECYMNNTFREGYPLMNLEGRGSVQYHIKSLNLVTGEYWLEVGIRKQNAFPFDYKEKAIKLNMTATYEERGVVRLEHEWRFTDEDTK